MDPERQRRSHEVEYGELPELTRALRALGSSRGGGGALHAQFFHPLLEARRRAADAKSPPAAIRAFDVADLTRALERILDRIVNDWPDARPSVRRALKAELAERLRPYRDSLDRLGDLASAALVEDEHARLDAWREWTGHLAATFEAADRGWMALRSVVESIPPKPKP